MVVRHGDDIVEDEVWSFDRALGREEAKSMAAALFADGYDLLNFVAHGED